MNCQEIEIAVARFFGYRANLIVPNVTWGLDFRHELDLAILTRSGHLTEVEIKTNLADLKRDQEKNHNAHRHPHPRIRRLFFAYPKTMDSPEAQALVPDHAGILTVERKHYKGYKDWTGKERPAHTVLKASTARAAKPNREARKLDPESAARLPYLAAMRIWTLKEHIQTQARRYRDRKKKTGQTSNEPVT